MSVVILDTMTDADRRALQVNEAMRRAMFAVMLATDGVIQMRSSRARR